MKIPQIKSTPVVLNKNIGVIVKNANFVKIREFDSLSKAQRWLFLPNGSIWKYLFGTCPRNQRFGIKSKKLNERFHFELKK